MIATIVKVFLVLAQAFPTVFTFIADAIKGGTMPTEEEVERRISGIESASKTMDGEEDAAAKGAKA